MKHRNLARWVCGALLGTALVEAAPGAQAKSYMVAADGRPALVFKADSWAGSGTFLTPLPAVTPESGLRLFIYGVNSFRNKVTVKMTSTDFHNAAMPSALSGLLLSTKPVDTAVRWLRATVAAAGGDPDLPQSL
jgi:hypothetical protein